MKTFATLRSSPVPWIGGTVLLTWLTYLLITPTIGLNWIESWHNEQRAVQVALLVCTAVAYCLIRVLMEPEDWVGPWDFPAVLLAFLGFGVLSAMRAEFVFAALAEVSIFALLAILIILTARFVSSNVETYVRYVRWFALLLATAYVLGVATRYLAAFNLSRAIDLDVLILGYANPRFPSALHSVLIPFLALTAIQDKEIRSLRIGAAIVLSFLWAINVGLGTRGIWFAYAMAAAVALLLLGWRPLARLLAILTITVFAGVGLYFVFFSVIPALAGIGSAVTAPTDNLTTISLRDVLWQLSWQAVESSPWLGIGPMQFAALGSRVGAHPHNWPLQLAAEWGLPALGLCMVAIFRLGKTIRRSAAKNHIVPTATLTLAVVLMLGLVDGNLVMPVSQTAAALMVGVLLGALRLGDQQAKRVPVSAAFMTSTAFIAVVASGIAITFVAHTLPDQSRSISSFQHAYGGARVMPRFWEQGILRK